MKYFKKIGKTVIVLGFVSLLNDISSEMIYPVLPVFLTAVLGATPIQLGIIEGIAETASSLLKLFFGYYSDRIKKKKPFIIYGYGIAAFSRILIAMSRTWYFVLGCRFIDRAGKGMRTAPRDALISTSASRENIGKAFGFHRSMDHTGALLGPIIAFGILYLTKDNYRFLFFTAGMIGLLSVIVAAFFLKEKKTSEDVKTDPVKIDFRYFQKNFYIFMGSILIFTLGNSSDAFLLLKAKNSGVPVAFLPILWSVLHLSKSLFSIIGGNISDIIPRKKVVQLGWLIYVGVYYAFGVFDDLYIIWVIFVFYGIYFGFTEGTQKAMVADMINREEYRGSAYGIYNFVIGIGSLPASIIFGLIWNIYGSSTAFFTGSGLALVSVLTISFVKTP
ncbi:MFS transporter [uncultured Ilyobacter sp.]|uniref:MFS transporter n=1 Tax=uncultured Ilyobacter sp. TaxID=544433 RepID=UPI0029F55F57|nr:MFS transporter [uncultured Ilyobacter sp.]